MTWIWYFETIQSYKGGKAQKFIAQVEKQVHTGGKVNTWAQVRLSLKSFDFFNFFFKDQEKRRAAEKKAQKEAELKEMEMLFGKAITAKGSKFMVDPKAKKAEKKSKFWLA